MNNFKLEIKKNEVRLYAKHAYVKNQYLTLAVKKSIKEMESFCIEKLANSYYNEGLKELFNQ
jgi:hypothetical protein